MQDVVRTVDSGSLYRRVADVSVGELVLRSAAVIEQTFGGLTSNLWDDPFEWTLPETLATSALVIDHMAEIDALRQTFFRSINNDEALTKYVSVPSGESRTLIDLLLEALVRASEYRGRARILYLL